MGTIWKMKSWRGVQSVRKTGNGGGRVAGERGYGVMFSPYGSMGLKALYCRTRQVHVRPKAKPVGNVESQTTLQRCVSPSPLPNRITSNSAAKKQMSTRSQLHKKSWQVAVMMNIYTQRTTVRMPPKSPERPLILVML